MFRARTQRHTARNHPTTVELLLRVEAMRFYCMAGAGCEVMFS